MTEPKLELDPKYDHYDYPTTSPVPKSGHPGHTTPQQDAQVFQLRTQLEQLGYTERLDTLTMLRFLRARKFDVEASKKMFIDCEKWRKEFGVDDLVQNFEYKEKAEVFEYYPQYYHKTDKDGRPVYIEHLGKIDLNKMYKLTTAQRQLQNLVVEYEKMSDPRLPACSRKAGHLLETCCTIMDLKGVGITMAPSVYGYVRETSAVSQNYYPERLGKLYVINAPWGFSTVFSVVKGFLDPVTVDKIHVLGSGYQAELLKQVDKENLPEVLGGTCHCAEGCMMSDAGPWHDPEWARPPAWAKDKAAKKEGAIENLPQAEAEKKEAEAGAGDAAAAPPAAADGAAEAAEEAKAPAAA